MAMPETEEREKRPTDGSGAKPKEYVTKEMLLGEVVAQHPKAAFVMLQYGLHCIGCHVSAYETIEQGCLGHGMPAETMEEMLEDLNAFIAEEMAGKDAEQ